MSLGLWCRIGRFGPPAGVLRDCGDLARWSQWRDDRHARRLLPARPRPRAPRPARKTRTNLGQHRADHPLPIRLRADHLSALAPIVRVTFAVFAASDNLQMNTLAAALAFRLLDLDGDRRAQHQEGVEPQPCRQV